MSTTTNQLARDLLEVCIGALPGGSVALKLFGSDFTRLMEEVLPTKDRRSVLQRLADDLAGSLIARSESMPRNSGSAESAAYDVVDSIKRAHIDFEVLRMADFEPTNLKRHIDQHRPSDWRFAGNERKQMWDGAVEEFCDRLLLHFLNDQAFQTQLLILVYRQQQQLLKRGAALDEVPTEP